MATNTKTSVEILLKSLAFAGIPERRLMISRNLLTVDLIWPKVGTARKSASRQVVMKKGRCDFTAEPWAKRVLFREEIDDHCGIAVALTEPVSLQKLRRLVRLTEKLVLKEGAEMIGALCLAYGDIASAPVSALAVMAGEKEAPKLIAQGVIDYSELPVAGEAKEVTIPLIRPKSGKAVGMVTMVVNYTAK